MDEKKAGGHTMQNQDDSGASPGAAVASGHASTRTANLKDNTDGSVWQSPDDSDLHNPDNRKLCKSIKDVQGGNEIF